MPYSKNRPLFNRWGIVTVVILLIILFTPIPKQRNNICIAVMGTNCKTKTFYLDQPVALKLINNLMYMKPTKSTSNLTPTPTFTLAEKAQKNGFVRIIVSIHVEEPPENWTKDSALEAAYKQKIAEAQNSLLEDLAQYGIKNPRKFEIIPAIAMTVNAEALQFLNTSPKVSGIEGDELSFTN